MEATAAAVSAFPVDRLVTVLVGDAAQIEEPVKALGIGEVTVVTRVDAGRRTATATHDEAAPVVDSRRHGRALSVCPYWCGRLPVCPVAMRYKNRDLFA